MSAVADFTIRHEVARCLIDEISLPQLRVWVLEHASKAEAGSDEELLLTVVERACTAFYDRSVDEGWLRSALLAIVTG